MEKILLLAGLRLRILSESILDIDPALNNFIIPTVEKADVTVRISLDWESFTLPSSPQLGEDSICRYYQEGDKLYCLTKGSSQNPVACSVYDYDCREICCVLNEKPFQMPPKNLGSILRMIPMRAVFQRFGVLFLHASRICYQGKAILFAAPSGIGKTTQAKLWRNYRNAEILCNDRTLLRRVDGIWRSYGYPLDGSEPVRSSAVTKLGAVVLLAQGQKNHVEHLRPGSAAVLLMNQSVIDVWNPNARQTAVEAIFSLIKDIPIYLLTCTPDERAVEILEEALMKEEVIIFE